MQTEAFMSGKDLVTEEQWQGFIDGLRKITPEKPVSDEILKKYLVDAIAKRIPNERFGLLLSGGVDSSLIALICKQKGADFICYSVGLEGSKDIEAAKYIADKLNLKLKIKIITLKELHEMLKKVVNILRTPDVTSVGVAAVEYAALEMAKEDKIKNIFGGLGSEEIFAGYERHEKAKDINEECWNGLKHMWKRDLIRDYLMATHFKVNFLTPFLDGWLIVPAMTIEGNKKINQEHKKVILREMAEQLGLPKETAWRKKLAAQYGSKITDAMDKLAKQHGFKYKKEYLENMLIKKEAFS